MYHTLPFHGVWKNLLLLDRATYWCQHTPFLSLNLRKTVHCETGLHINFTITLFCHRVLKKPSTVGHVYILTVYPFFLSSLKQTIHCGIELYFNFSYLFFLSRLENKRPLRDSVFHSTNVFYQFSGKPSEIFKKCT